MGTIIPPTGVHLRVGIKYLNQIYYTPFGYIFQTDLCVPLTKQKKSYFTYRYENSPHILSLERRLKFITELTYVISCQSVCVCVWCFCFTLHIHYTNCVLIFQMWDKVICGNVLCMCGCICW